MCLSVQFKPLAHTPSSHARSYIHIPYHIIQPSTHVVGSSSRSSSSSTPSQSSPSRLPLTCLTSPSSGSYSLLLGNQTRLHFQQRNGRRPHSFLSHSTRRRRHSTTTRYIFHSHSLGEQHHSQPGRSQQTHTQSVCHHSTIARHGVVSSAHPLSISAQHPATLPPPVISRAASLIWMVSTGSVPPFDRFGIQ